MAGLTETIICANCGAEVPRIAAICSCGSNPRRRTPAPDVDAPVAVEIRAKQVAGFLVTLPNFVTVEVPPGGVLPLGRGTGTEAIDGALELFIDVSREHAVLTDSGSGLLVTAMKTSYGTWLDRGNLSPFEPTPVLPGQVLRFGTNCYLKVTESNVR